MSDYTFHNQSLNLSAVRNTLHESIEPLHNLRPTKGREGLEIKANINLLDGSLDFSKLAIDEPCPALHLSAYKSSRGLVCSFQYNTFTLCAGGYTSSQFIIFGDYSDSTPAVKARNTEKNLFAVWETGLDVLPEQLEKVIAFYNIVDSSI